MMNNGTINYSSDSSIRTISTLYYLIPLLGFYTLLCSLLRFRRRDAMHKKYNYPDRASFSKMTNDDAHAIVNYMLQLEFPRFYELSVQFALFKTYGIPTISSILVATKQFSTPEFASKRYTDTTVLIQEFVANAPRSERAIKAISRMNYIHSKYQKSGKISNEDLLYTLSVFITEPITWISKYEWRNMTPMEICAVATFWKSIGDAMGIQYEGCLTQQEWKDGLEFYEDISQWADAYERQFMVPAMTNKKTSDELVPLLLYYIPEKIRSPAEALIGVIMSDRLRKAMMYPDPSKGYHLVAAIVLQTRRFILRYLSLPRPDFMYVNKLGDTDAKTGRHHFNTYLNFPYYVKPTFMSRWGPSALLVRLAGGPVPGADGSTYIPQGYHFSEVGPKSMFNHGAEETAAIESKLQAERPSGCPFAFSK